MSDKALTALGFVLRGKTRENVFKELEKPTVPSKIAQKTGIRAGTVSRTLLELLKEELVRCVNPKAKRGRVYQLTELGKQVFELIAATDEGKI